jgi:hypothetical protein
VAQLAASASLTALLGLPFFVGVVLAPVLRARLAVRGAWVGGGMAGGEGMEWSGGEGINGGDDDD